MTPSIPAISPVPRMVGILGGMGPAAGADFVRLFVEACTRRMAALGIPVRDQAYPEHWLAQVPIPDRTAALGDRTSGAHQPAEPMAQATGRLVALGVQAVAIACNTAHAWHGELQQRFPQLQVLHGMREVAAGLAAAQVPRVALLATQGSYDSGLYQAELLRHGVACVLPQPGEREQLMQGIYDGVKAGDYALARHRFAAVAQALRERDGVSTLIMGCTEIPLALDEAAAGARLVNPSQVLAEALARCAYAGIEPRTPARAGADAIGLTGDQPHSAGLCTIRKNTASMATKAG